VRLFPSDTPGRLDLGKILVVGGRSGERDQKIFGKGPWSPQIGPASASARSRADHGGENRSTTRGSRALRVGQWSTPHWRRQVGQLVSSSNQWRRSDLPRLASGVAGSDEELFLPRASCATFQGQAFHVRTADNQKPSYKSHPGIEQLNYKHGLTKRLWNRLAALSMSEMGRMPVNYHSPCRFVWRQAMTSASRIENRRAGSQH